MKSLVTYESDMSDEDVPMTNRNTNASKISGLVSYATDEDDNFDDDNNKENDVPSINSMNDEEPSNEKENFVSVDDDECFNIEDRESDFESDDNNGLAGDLVSKSGTDQSVKTDVLTKLPTDSGKAYSLPRQIYNNPTEIKLPPIPSAKALPEHEQRILELRNRVKNSSLSMAQSILLNKSYRNPSIYEKLIEHMKIDERGTNYPPELYDPHRFGEESFYESLAKAQDEAERKRLEQGRSGANKTAKISELKVRKSKWDTGSKL